MIRDELHCVIQDITKEAQQLRNQRDELLHMLATVLPFIEDAEGDKCYKPGVVNKLVAQIKSAVEGGAV